MPFIGLFIGPIKVEGKVCNVKVHLHSQFWLWFLYQLIPAASQSTRTNMHTIARSSSIPDKVQTSASFNWFLNLFLKTHVKELNYVKNRDQNWDKSNKSAHLQPLGLRALWNNVLRNHQMASSLLSYPTDGECHEKREQWIQCSLLDGCEDFSASPTMICAQEGLFSLGEKRKARSATRWSCGPQCTHQFAW